MDGNVILWEISSDYEDKNLILEKFYEYNLTKSIDEIYKPCYEIQSVTIGSKYILVGTKNGNIYEMQIPNDSQYQQESSSMINLRLSSHDNEIPKVQQLNTNSQMLYIIS